MTSAEITTEELPQPAENIEKNKKGWLKRAFAVAGDMAGRAAVTNLVKIGTASVLVGAGASAVLTVAGAAVATGIGAALYTYGRDTWKARREASLNNTEFKWFDFNRVKAARFSLLCGVAGGALGAWLASSETVQWAAKWTFDKAGDTLSSIFSGAAESGAVSDAAATAAATAVEAKASVLARLSQTLAEHGAEGSRLAGWLATVDLNDTNSVTPQFLKDAAHDVLRVNDIPEAERFALARELATEAQARGNEQAGQFLNDLARLEAGEAPVAAPSATPSVAATGEVSMAQAAPNPEFLAEMQKALAELDVQADANAAAETAAAAQEALQETTPQISVDPSVFEGDDSVTAPATSVSDIAPITQTFGQEAAVCNVTVNAPAGVAVEVSCSVSKTEMSAGDFIRFTDGAGQSVTTDLLAGSARVETHGFLQGPVIADGVDRLAQKLKL